jgi:hypothetical protein
MNDRRAVSIAAWRSGSTTRTAERAARPQCRNVRGELTEREIAHRRRMLAHLSRERLQIRPVVDETQNRADDIHPRPY